MSRRAREMFWCNVGPLTHDDLDLSKGQKATTKLSLNFLPHCTAQSVIVAFPARLFAHPSHSLPPALWEAVISAEGKHLGSAVISQKQIALFVHCSLSQPLSLSLYLRLLLFSLRYCCHLPNSPFLFCFEFQGFVRQLL